MISEESIRLKIRNKIYIPLTRYYRKKKINKNDFTIISNNCWGGTIYESYNMKKQSPTIGMFIMPEDYLAFIGNLEYYLNQNLEIIDCDKSKWKNQLCEKSNWGTYIIGKLDDIELHMLHYHDKKIAEEKWKKRISRVNMNHLLIKFNDQNGCTLEHIKRFSDLNIKNKICFVCKKEYVCDSCVVYIKQPKKCNIGGIKASREPIGSSRFININNLINKL